MLGQIHPDGLEDNAVIDTTRMIQDGDHPSMRDIIIITTPQNLEGGAILTMILAVSILHLPPNSLLHITALPSSTKTSTALTGRPLLHQSHLMVMTWCAVERISL